MGYAKISPFAMARQQPIAYADNRNKVEHAGFSDEFWRFQNNVPSVEGQWSDNPELFLIQCESEDDRLGLDPGTTYQNWLTAI